MALAGVVSVLVFALSTAAPAAEPQAISLSEQKLLMEDHLANTPGTRTLRYHFKHSGTQESGFDDTVTVRLEGTADKGRLANVSFLTGERAFALPAVEHAKGNPVILSFLERDVREMQRLTKGQPNYFRKRLRMALADTARLEDTVISVQGESVPGWKITLHPYVDDPLKPRFGRLAGKRYSFTLSDRIPGWVYEMRTVVEDSGEPPLIEEVLTFAGVQSEVK